MTRGAEPTDDVGVLAERMEGMKDQLESLKNDVTSGIREIKAQIGALDFVPREVFEAEIRTTHTMISALEGMTELRNAALEQRQDKYEVRIRQTWALGLTTLVAVVAVAVAVVALFV